jgi:hypothetical protein
MCLDGNKQRKRFGNNCCWFTCIYVYMNVQACGILNADRASIFILSDDGSSLVLMVAEVKNKE